VKSLLLGHKKKYFIYYLLFQTIWKSTKRPFITTQITHSIQHTLWLTVHNREEDRERWWQRRRGRWKEETKDSKKQQWQWHWQFSDTDSCQLLLFLGFILLSFLLFSVFLLFSILLLFFACYYCFWRISVLVVFSDVVAIFLTTTISILIFH